MGNHLESLNERAHSKSHGEAQEKKKKGKKSKKGGSKKEGAVVKSDATQGILEENEEEAEYVIEDEEFSEEELDNEEDPRLPDLQKIDARMKKIASRFEESLKAIRGAEPTVELFDSVQVDAYGDGTKSPLSAVAQVVLISPTLANATCFDPATSKAVQTALALDLQLNASVEQDEHGGSGTLRIPLPRVSLERRQKSSQLLHKRAEAVRQRIRQVRRQAMNRIKQGVAGKLAHVSKDDAFRAQNELESTTESSIEKINKATATKDEKIMGRME